MRQSYKPKSLCIDLQDKHRGSWQQVGEGRAVKGTEYLYSVKDQNYSSLNRWTIAVRVPNSPFDAIIVQPLITPGKKVWAGLERNSIVLVRAKKNPFKGRVYCKLNLADPSGWQTKKGTRRGERNALPKWFRFFAWRMRLKHTVTTTKGTDAKAQVVLIRPEDHNTMIRLFFALKVWVMAEGFVLEHE